MIQAGILSSHYHLNRWNKEPNKRLSLNLLQIQSHVNVLDMEF